MLTAGLMVASPAQAAVYQVTNTQDSGAGSLRDAINEANASPGADTITFAATVTGTIALTSGPLYITDDLDVQGPGADTLTIDGNGIVASPVQGNGAPSVPTGNVFIAGALGQDVLASVTQAMARTTAAPPPPSGSILDVSLSGLTITGGHSVYGAGVLAQASNLDISQCVISGNTAIAGGGGVVAINKYSNSTAALTITDSVISQNTVHDPSSSSSSPSRSIGGGVFAFMSDISVSGSSIRDNTVGNSDSKYDNVGGGGGMYAVAASLGDSGPIPGTLRISDSTISGNQALGPAASVYYGSPIYYGGGGGGLVIGLGDATISNSTIANNYAEGLGGGVLVNPKYATHTENSTISGNSAGYAGGGFAAYSANDAAATQLFRNSVIGGNSAPTDPDFFSMASPPDNPGDPVPVAANLDLAYSLVQVVGSAPITDSGGNIFGQDPMLGALADNGGPTMTLLPQSGSPLIDAGDPAFAGPPNTDQRGSGFSRIVGGRVDMGATEFGAGSAGGGEFKYVAVPGLGWLGKLGLGGLLGLLGLTVARRRRKPPAVARG